MPDVAGAVLIDTSTLTDLAPHDPDGPTRIDPTTVTAIEAMVLFEQVYLDGRTVETELYGLQWIDELDAGIQLVNRTREEVEATYSRGMTLADHLTRSPATAAFLSSRQVPDLAAELALRRYTPDTHTVWGDLSRFVSLGGSRQLGEFVGTLRAELHLEHPGGAIVLARLCYYLALQEELGLLVLLHPTKLYGGQPIQYGPAETILDRFDNTVRAAYQQRRRDWLGDANPLLPIPLLARYVMRESARRGWSLGRTISWLRTEPEVHQFRVGVSEMLALVEAEDHHAVDAILVELEQAALAWSRKLGSKPAARKVPLQVPIPLAPTFATSVDIPLPRFTNTPARRMLVLVDRLLSGAMP
jgi:hypothetical protein